MGDVDICSHPPSFPATMKMVPETEACSFNKKSLCFDRGLVSSRNRHVVAAIAFSVSGKAKAAVRNACWQSGNRASSS